MRIKWNYIASLLAGTAAVAIVAAPLAAADPAPVKKTCISSISSGYSGTRCDSPGNVEINASPPSVSAGGYLYSAGQGCSHRRCHHNHGGRGG